MANRYRRKVRLEDWKGNIYEFGGSGSGGISVDTEDVDNVYNKSDGSIVADNTTNNGSSIYIPHYNINKECISAIFEDLKFGTYSVMFRLKTSNNTITDKLIVINSYYNNGNSDSLLSTTYLAPSDFDNPNVFQTFGFVTKLKGINSNNTINLKIKITILGNNYNDLSFWFDYIIINYAYTSVLGRITSLV